MVCFTFCLLAVAIVGIRALQEHTSLLSLAQLTTHTVDAN